jgi:SecD/SecF fusion protein
MPTNYSSRITLIFVVLIGSICGIVNPMKLFNSSIPWSEKTHLKPGIDIAGGESLLYEIKLPPGSTGAGNSGQTVAEEVAAALKKRVDPHGVLNLVWRPQGDKRLEIQIPRAANAGKRDEARKELSAALDEFKKTNLNITQVQAAIEKSSGAAREKQLSELAGGNPERVALFKSLAALHDEIEKAKVDFAAASKANDAAAKGKAADLQAQDEIKYEAELKQVDEGNLSIEEVQTVLDQPPAVRAQRVEELNARYKDSPARLAALKHLEVADVKFKAFKDQVEGAIDLKRMLRGSGVLEFHILVTELNTPEAQAMIDRLKSKGPAVQALDTMRWYRVDNPDEFRGTRTFQQDGDTVNHYVLAYTTPDKQMVHTRNANSWALVSAQPSRDQNGGSAVAFSFDAQGAKLFSDLTRNNIHFPLGIVLDDRMISAPNLNSEIGANGQITGGNGGFSDSQLKYLVNTLSAGSLPATLADEPISERTVSPQLGEDNLRAGLVATGVGLVVVSIFLVGYYHLAGLVAFFAVMMNLVIILGVLAMFGATFTMPSIAGIVLTVGTAIDANVLVFERMREEEHRGFPLKLALTHAYDRALSAIVDSNMTTAIVSIFLYVFGSEEVKGFGLTLLIGIISSLFTALFVTKTIFAILIDKRGIKELGSIPTSFPKWDAMLKPNIDWMGLIWPFIAFSTIFTIVGLSAFVIKKRDMFDIEFASGTSVQIELKEGSGLPLAEVRKLIGKRPDEIPSPSVVSINNSDRNYEVVTPTDKATKVRDAVLEVLGPYLKIERPSKFEQAGVKVEEAISKSIIPIEKDSLTIDEQPIAEAAGYVGGAAVVLRNLEPPISPNEIRSRIDSASAAPGSETNLAKWRLEVVGIDPTTPKDTKDKANYPVKAAVILALNPAFPYARSAEGWKENNAVPMWKLANEGVNREARLQKVSNFDPQVAGDTRFSAFMATSLSIVAIMIYIWFRFGDMKYATATVVALLHDTLIVVGAVGLSHLLDNGFGHVLLIEPFRINLTLVAAILTIMGYSMIDTIVVFDRIRENRGRYGRITRQVINDSINQTLSRTLLTASTTLIMVAVMYICGGPGIHGFTFVLLVGILVGTYSSVAIAAPLLLVGGHEQIAPQSAQNVEADRRPTVVSAARRGADLGTVKRT